MKNTPLMHTNIQLLYCSDTPLPITVIGKIRVQIETPELATEGIVFVVRGLKANNLLGLHAGRELKLLQVNTITEHADIIQQFPDVTKGIGKLKDVLVKIHIDETVPPVAQTNWRTPFRKNRREIEETGPFHNTSAPARLRLPVPHVSTKPLKSSLQFTRKDPFLHLT